MGMTKRVVTSLLLSTALLPMINSKADTVKSTSKGAAVTTDGTANTTNEQQVTLGATSQSTTSAAASSTTSQTAVSDSTSATSQASDAASTATSVTSRVTVRASVADSTATSTASQGAQSTASAADKTAASAASETAKTTASAADQLNSSAASSAAASSVATSSVEQSVKQSTAQSAASDATSVTVKVEAQATSATAQQSIMATSATVRTATTSQDQFLSQIKAGAISGWYKYQVLPSVTAAQAILESGWGQSQLSTVGNNLFGIKGSYQGQSVYFPTQEWTENHYITIQDAFRKYPNWSASVEDHGAFLTENSRYNNLIGVTDYKKVASRLQQDGYATAPTYASSLISIIEYNNLDAWDREVLSGQTTDNTASNNGGGTQTTDNVTAASGTYKFTKTTAIHNTADQNSAVVGTYNAGESVSYNGKLTVNNATWLRYQSYSGVARYVMISQPSTNNTQQTVTPASGSFKFTAKTNIRDGASKTAKVVGTYNTGDTVYYNGKVTTGGQTWLRYLSNSGSQRYVAMSGDTVGSTTTTTTKPNVTAATGSYRFTQATAIKTSPATNATTVGSYNSGDTVYYNGKVTVGSQTWLRYRSYSGADHYVQMQTSSTTSVTKPQVTAQSGSYKFTQSTAIKSTPDSTTASVGTYNAGDTVYYNAKVTANGQTWLRYQSYSGKQHYVAVGGGSNASTSSTTSQSANQVTSQNGSYRFTTTTNIRTAPSTKAAVVGQYKANETVYYNGSVKAEGYTWLRYLSASGAVRYVAEVK